MALVELRNVSKIYHLGGEEIRALDDIAEPKFSLPYQTGSAGHSL
jgi:hypothetical protein